MLAKTEVFTEARNYSSRSKGINLEDLVTVLTPSG
jgi:hypothetical protein